MKAFKIILFAIVLSAAGCTYRVERDYRVLSYHLNGDVDSLNPITSTTGNSRTVESFIFDSLLDRDPETLEMRPMIAKRWEVSDNHLEYTFYLRDDVYWHDGKKLTVDDVIYSYERLMDPKVDAASLRHYYRDISKVEKVNDYTVKFFYAFPYYRALIMLGGLPVLPKHILDDGTDFNKHPFGRNPVGNGPLKFKEWKTGSLIVLERNENYWGKKPGLIGITFRIIPEISVAFQVLKKGEIDLMELSAIQWAKETDSKNFERRFDKYKYFLPGYSYIAWNRDLPFFKDRRVRKALAMMLNKREIAEKLVYGLTEEITGDAYKFGPDYNKGLVPIEYDPEDAVRLLNEAGWVDSDGDGILDKDGLPFKFTFMVTGSRPNRVINILRENLKRIGIDMNIGNFEWTVFIKNIHDRSFDAAALVWGGTPDTDPYQIWHSSQIDKGSNYVGFSVPEADRLIEEGRREFDPEKRHTIYRRFHEILYDEQPYLFLFMQPSLVAVQKRFTNVNVYKMGVDIREWGVTEPTMKLYQ